MFCMQSSKTSKKTRKIGEETAAVPENAAGAEITSNARTTRSSKSKNSEGSETGLMHRKAASKPVPEQTAPAPEVKTMAAGVASATQPMNAREFESASGITSPTTANHEKIAALAYSYWVARGYAPGSPEQDWLRAERELQAQF